MELESQRIAVLFPIRPWIAALYSVFMNKVHLQKYKMNKTNK